MSRQRLTVERLFGDPPIAVLPPQRLRFSPDGLHLAWLMPAFDQRGRLDLWLGDAVTGRSRVLLDARSRVSHPRSAADQERLERQRQFAAGVTTFDWFPDGQSLLVPMGSTVLRVALDGSSTDISPDAVELADLRLSPRGTWLTWVAGGDLWLHHLEDRRTVRVTSGGSAEITHGLAEFIAQEEMHRFEGYWWAPDESRLVFTRVDASVIPETHRLEVVQDDVRAIAQRYAYAGGPNARVSLHEYVLASGEIRALEPGLEPEDYLARVNFVGGDLAVQIQHREQQWLQLRGQSDNGDFVPWLTETSDTWINLHDNLRPLPDGRFLWTSEREGLARLMAGQRGHPESVRFVSPPDLHVTQVLAVDGDRAWVQGWREQPTQRHLFEVDLQTSTARALTHAPGWHDGTVHAATRRYACVFSSTTVLPELRLLHLETGRRETLVTLPANHAAREYLLPAPQFGTLAAADGQPLWWRVTPPSNLEPDQTYPVIVYVYGGPGAQKVCDTTLPGLVILLADAGFGVLELDNRGSANRGRSFEAPLYRHMGGVEVEDQVRGLEVLRDFAWADLSRTGVFGHSYGGFMSLMCICRHPEVFKAAVAVAPVSDWKLYDTHYTERYLGNPAIDDSPYRNSSVLPHLAGLKRPLLLVHGMADDNVLVTHTTRVMRELQKHGLPFELMLYPGSRHALQEKDVSIHRFRQLLDFFGRYLSSNRLPSQSGGGTGDA